MLVYHKRIDTGVHKHEYHALRRQKRSVDVKKLDATLVAAEKNNEEALIYMKDEPNTINAFNRVKDHLDDFKCVYNRIQCNIPPKEFVNKLNLY